VQGRKQSSGHRVLRDARIAEYRLIELDAMKRQRSGRNRRLAKAQMRESVDDRLVGDEGEPRKFRK